MPLPRRCINCSDRPAGRSGLCPECARELASEAGVPLAKCSCGATFADPRAAAEHWRDSGHATWSVPSSWLAGRPWSQPEFWRHLLETE